MDLSKNDRMIDAIISQTTSGGIEWRSITLQNEPSPEPAIVRAVYKTDLMNEKTCLKVRFVVGRYPDDVFLSTHESGIWYCLVFSERTDQDNTETIWEHECSQNKLEELAQIILNNIGNSSGSSVAINCSLIE